MALKDRDKRVAPGIDDGHAGRDEPIGTPEHLRSTFSRASAATDRAVGVWLSRSAIGRSLADSAPSADNGAHHDLQALRALVRASATAYVRRLKEAGMPPERMLVLVKNAAGHPGAAGFAAQELTNDVVRWSIEAYFDD